MDALIAEVKRLAVNADEKSRRQIMDSLHNLAYSIETPQDTIQRIMYSNIPIAAARIGIDLELFDILAASGNQMTVEQLAQKTGADPLLLGRILRYLASVSMIKETDEDNFAATNVTKALAIPGFQAGIHHNFDALGPIFQNLPDFLKETNYVNPEDSTKCALQRAWNTALPGFTWVATHPQKAAYFTQFMTAQREGTSTWLDEYPVEKQAEGREAAKQPLFVDMGGGAGHQSIALRERFPRIPGRVIVQDLPYAIEMVSSPREGVEYMVHDFFQPQTVKGSRFYYMRNILHDHADLKCLIILKNILAAMDTDSLILIDDMVIPNSGVHSYATQIDLTMMASIASRERTKEQWLNLLETAGLKVNQIYTYRPSTGDSIIEATKV